MARFKLTTDDVFVKDGYKVQVLTSGIDLSLFSENPIMLFDHKSDEVIGTWSNITKSDIDIEADTEFDVDEDSIAISDKVMKGTIKSASAGLDVVNAYMNGDVIVIDKSVLLEGSLVAIPQNPKAKKVTLANSNCTLQLSASGMDFKSFAEGLSTTVDSKEVDVKVGDIDTEVVTEVVEEVKEEVIVAEVIENEVVETPALDLIGEKLELSKTIEVINAEKVLLSTKVTNLELSLQKAELEVASLNKIVANYNSEKLDNLLTLAINDGKITKEAKPEFLTLSYDVAKSIIDKLAPKSQSLSGVLTTKLELSKDVKTYDWYMKNNKLELSKLAKENPALYKQLEQEYVNSLNK